MAYSSESWSTSAAYHAIFDSDLLGASFGMRSAALSLAALQIFGLLGAWHYWMAAKFIKPGG